MSRYFYCCAECHFSECRFYECLYDECRGAQILRRPNVGRPHVCRPNVIRRNDMAPLKIATPSPTHFLLLPNGTAFISVSTSNSFD